VGSNNSCAKHSLFHRSNWSSFEHDVVRHKLSRRYPSSDKGRFKGSADSFDFGDFWHASILRIQPGDFRNLPDCSKVLGALRG
jgi:hypothetical protein